MPSTTLESVVPILPSGDLGRAEAFYTYLGFRVTGRGADYLQLVHGGIELHLYLTAGLDPLVNPAGCYLRVADPARLRAAWCTDGINCLEVPGCDGYGETLFALIDPDGNTLRYGPAE
jgi:catechol 2,3-dioxygenase-like lactoylglutathione lyase family enzyme